MAEPEILAHLDVCLCLAVGRGLIAQLDAEVWHDHALLTQDALARHDKPERANGHARSPQGGVTGVAEGRRYSLDAHGIRPLLSITVLLLPYSHCELL